MEQKDLDEFWGLLESYVKPLAEKEQRKVAYLYCTLAKKDFDKLALYALELVRRSTVDHVPLKKLKSSQYQLRIRLPEEGVSPYSPLIWALEPNSASYPTWNSAGIVGLNIVDLKIATLPQLTNLTKEHLQL